jgi:TATA-box binding protein (TBP) (component of TFIID and TFIIIB)
MRITHEIFKTKLSIGVSLEILELQIPATRKKTPFDLLTWREFGGCCLIYKSGKIICHGNAVTAYCRQLQVLGYNTSAIHTVTKSATHTLLNPVDYRILVKEGFLWEPELFHAPVLKKNNKAYIVYFSGKVIITGIKTKEDYREVEATLSQIEYGLYNSNN